MKLLLDTHTILWMVSDDRRLSARARRTLESAPRLCWSVVSLWEIGIKLSLDRPGFQLGPGWARRIPEEMSRNGIERLDLAPDHCDRVSRLPWHHRDPFDRLLIAMAAAEELGVIGADETFDRYGIERIW